MTTCLRCVGHMEKAPADPGTHHRTARWESKLTFHISFRFSYFLLSVCVCVSIRKVHIIPTWQTTPMLLNGVNFTSHSHNSSPAAISVFPQYILRNGSHIKQTYLLFGGLLLLYLICEMSVFLPRRRGFKSNRVEQRNFK